MQSQSSQKPGQNHSETQAACAQPWALGDGLTAARHREFARMGPFAIPGTNLRTKENCKAIRPPGCRHRPEREGLPARQCPTLRSNLAGPGGWGGRDGPRTLHGAPSMPPGRRARRPKHLGHAVSSAEGPRVPLSQGQGALRKASSPSQSCGGGRQSQRGRLRTGGSPHPPGCPGWGTG